MIRSNANTPSRRWIILNNQGTSPTRLNATWVLRLLRKTGEVRIV
jgi:hypothetical protein